MPETATTHRQIPSIDRLLQRSVAAQLDEKFGRELTLEAYREATRCFRNALSEVAFDSETDVGDWLDCRAECYLTTMLEPSLRSVFNLTGTVLHTNLGRAPLPQEAIDAITRVAGQPSNLEYDLDQGKRGDRDAHVERWLCRLTGAEAALVVNNNAAAVMLSLNTLANRRSVAVSRGELIEIGGSFRIPDIMKKAGCKLLEVGTTNRTHVEDYVQAIEQGATTLMRVHTSNFKINGYTASVDDKILGEIAHDNDVVFINDLGSGALVDLSQFGLPAELTPRQALKSGSHVVTFSGDKLLGGPQCGLLVGDRKRIDLIRKNPMRRALRCDKMTLAALEETLKLYAHPEQLCKRIPALRLLTRSKSEIAALAVALQPHVSDVVAGYAHVDVVDCKSQIGSGALPVSVLPSTALVLKPNRKSNKALINLANAFRQLPKPMIGRIHDKALWFDLRCIESPDDMIEILPFLQLS